MTKYAEEKIYTKYRVAIFKYMLYFQVIVYNVYLKFINVENEESPIKLKL